MYCAYATWWERQNTGEGPKWSGEKFREVEEHMRAIGRRILKRPGMKEKTLRHIEEKTGHKL